jgi:hypothetical protein
MSVTPFAAEVKNLGGATPSPFEVSPMSESAAHHVLAGESDRPTPDAHASDEHRDPVAEYHQLKESIAHMRKGALHAQMGYAPGTRIPKAALEHAAKSPDKLLAHRAQFALTMEGWSHGHAGHPEAERRTGTDK